MATLAAFGLYPNEAKWGVTNMKATISATITSYCQLARGYSHSSMRLMTFITFSLADASEAACVTRAGIDSPTRRLCGLRRWPTPLAIARAAHRPRRIRLEWMSGNPVRWHEHCHGCPGERPTVP